MRLAVQHPPHPTHREGRRSDFPPPHSLAPRGAGDIPPHDRRTWQRRRRPCGPARHRPLIEDISPAPAVAAAELKAGLKTGARLIRCDAPDYPALLRRHCRRAPGDLGQGQSRRAAPPDRGGGGARNASSLGLRMARGMTGALAQARRSGRRTGARDRHRRSRSQPGRPAPSPSWRRTT